MSTDDEGNPNASSDPNLLFVLYTMSVSLSTLYYTWRLPDNFVYLTLTVAKAWPWPWDRKKGWSTFKKKPSGNEGKLSCLIAGKVQGDGSLARDGVWDGNDREANWYRKHIKPAKCKQPPTNEDWYGREYRPSCISENRPIKLMWITLSADGLPTSYAKILIRQDRQTIIEILQTAHKVGERWGWWEPGNLL